MIGARGSHHCQRIRRSQDSQDYDVIVLGRTLANTQLVEIYDSVLNAWTYGPNPPGKFKNLIFENYLRLNSLLRFYQNYRSNIKDYIRDSSSEVDFKI